MQVYLKVKNQVVAEKVLLHQVIVDPVVVANQAVEILDLVVMEDLQVEILDLVVMEDLQVEIQNSKYKTTNIMVAKDRLVITNKISLKELQTKNKWININNNTAKKENLIPDNLEINNIKVIKDHQEIKIINKVEIIMIKGNSVADHKGKDNLVRAVLDLMHRDRDFLVKELVRAKKKQKNNLPFVQTLVLKQ